MTAIEAMKSSKTVSSPALDHPIPCLNISTAFVLWLALTTLLPLQGSTKIPNTLGLSILFFNNLNIMIAFCEIALGNHIRFIQEDYQRLQKQYKGKELQAAFGYLFHPLTLHTIFDGPTWARMWSTYSLWDPSYSNPESFGFFIDVGNGWSTILPCLLWNVAIVCPTFIHRHKLDVLVGFVGACSYWQVLYGTVIYLLSFLWNKRFVGKPLAEVLGFVGVANGIWLVFPVAALYASYQILRIHDCSQVFGA